MALTNSLASSLFPTIGPNGYQAATGAYQNGKNLIPIGSYKPAATTDWSNPMSGLGQDALTALQNGQPYVLPGGHYDPMGKSYGVITAGNMPGTGAGPISFNSTENGPGTTIDNPAMRGYSYIPMDGQQKNANDYWFNPDGSYNSSVPEHPDHGLCQGHRHGAGCGSRLRCGGCCCGGRYGRRRRHWRS
jgi:hypothetical protein